MNRDISKLFINERSTIDDALKRMAENKPQESGLPAGIVLAVSSQKKLLGIATEGDIRRALSRGAKIMSPISSAMNKTPFLIEGPKTSTEILSLVVDKIKKENWHKDRLDKIVIVDAARRVLDVVSFYDLWQQSDLRFKHIGIVGLGYVGLTLGLTFADLGFKVKGFDKNKIVSEAIKNGKPHFFEIGLASLLKDHSDKNFKVVKDFRKENNCDVYFLSVGTPLDKNKKPDLEYLGLASKNLGSILKRGDAVILRSTVPVGTTRNFVLPMLEKASGLKAGDDFFLAFAPERTIEGKALEELRKLPQVIGGINHRSAEVAADFFSFMTNSTLLVDSLEEAEMVKLINNTYRDVTFGFANEVSLVAQRWGIDAKRVIEAANYGYERSSVPNPSPGVGGYCLEKDPFIFIESAKQKGYNPMLFHHARAVSDKMLDFLADSVKIFLRDHKKDNKNAKILALGIAFKGRPATSDTRGSTSLALLNQLRRENYKNIYGFDPAVRRADFQAHGIKYVNDLKKGFSSADIVLVLTNHQDFESIDARKYLALSAKPVLFYDTWGVFNKSEVAKIKGVHYKQL